jgi:hypothetical protein
MAKEPPKAAPEVSAACSTSSPSITKPSRPPKCSSALKPPTPNPPTPSSSAISTTATAATAPPTAAHGIGAGVETGKGKVGAALWFKPAGGGKGGKGGAGSFVKHTWDRFVPIVARSMALAGKTVLVSGAPDTIDEEYAFERLAAKDPEILKELNEQNEALEGRRGAKMWAVNTETGEQSTGLELTSPPVCGTASPWPKAACMSAPWMDACSALGSSRVSF